MFIVRLPMRVRPSSAALGIFMRRMQMSPHQLHASFGHFAGVCWLLIEHSFGMSWARACSRSLYLSEYHGFIYLDARPEVTTKELYTNHLVPSGRGAVSGWRPGFAKGGGSHTYLCLLPRSVSVCAPVAICPRNYTVL